MWDLRAPPASVVAGEGRLGRKVVEQVARDIADTFPIEILARDLRAVWNQRPGLDELCSRWQTTRDGAAAPTPEEEGGGAGSPEGATLAGVTIGR